MVPLDKPLTAGFGLVLGVMAHLVGWVIPRGGAQRITDALVAHLRGLGGEVIADHRVRSLDELPPAKAILCDLSLRPVLTIAGGRLPAAYKRALEQYQYGMGVFKMDWALDGPIPWKAADCAKASTVHVCGTLAELERSEQEAWSGTASERPFVLLAQPSLFDPSRAPAGKHTAWAYCHVPGGSTVDMQPRIEAQIERFAPGFRDRILARSVMTPADVEAHNANYHVTCEHLTGVESTVSLGPTCILACVVTRVVPMLVGIGLSRIVTRTAAECARVIVALAPRDLGLPPVVPVAIVIRVVSVTAVVVVPVAFVVT